MLARNVSRLAAAALRQTYCSGFVASIEACGTAPVSTMPGNTALIEMLSFCVLLVTLDFKSDGNSGALASIKIGAAVRTNWLIYAT